MKVGDILKVAPPAGNFVYDPATDKELIFVAGGIGITPLLSMIERALEEGKMSNFCTQTDLLKLELSATFFKEYKSKFGDKFQAIEYFSEDNNTDDKIVIDKAFNRKLTTDDLDFIAPEHDVYLVGPREFMKDIKEHLGKKNVPVKLEYFGPYDP